MGSALIVRLPFALCTTRSWEQFCVVAACLINHDKAQSMTTANPTKSWDMFQTFSGSSRRPRQVNLSGQNVNPFAASPFGPSASGSQKTVAHAQQERQQRQRERERLNASKRIQRVWRGHKVRKELAESRRLLWDSVQAQGSEQDSVSVEQIKLLVAFFNSRRKDDLQRLITLSSRVANLGFENILTRKDVQSLLARLAHVTVDALQM